MTSDDRDALIDAVGPFAQQMLQKHRGFHPIGATINRDGEISLAAAFDGPEDPAPQEVIDLLLEAFRKQASASEIRACIVCYDGLIVRPGESRKSDAICMYFDHESGEASRVFQPYRKGIFGSVRFEARFASQEASRVFTARMQEGPIDGPRSE